MSYVQENATINEAIEALKAGAKVYHNDCGDVHIGVGDYLFDSDDEYMIFREQKLAGWRIEWPDAPRCDAKVLSACADIARKHYPKMPKGKK